MKIYLAGGNDSGWREKLEERWADYPVQLIDPFRDSRQDALYSFTNDDLQYVAECDIVLGYITYERYTGSALEFGFAHALGKKIVYATTLPRVDSMMASVASAVFTDLEAAVEFIERRML